MHMPMLQVHLGWGRATADTASRAAVANSREAFIIRILRWICILGGWAQ